jgi:hypothetical protein
MNKLIVCALVLGIGCGDDTHPATQPDAAVDAAVDGSSIDAPDHGQPSSTYPAFTVDMPTLTNAGGGVLANMTIVTVTWSNDPNAATFESLADGLGASNYWHALNSEYGVGPTTSTAADHVHITTTPPTTISDDQIKTMIVQNAGTNGWPAATASTMYAVYTPPGMNFTFAGGMQGCGMIGAIHEEGTAGNVTFPFAVMPGCTWVGSVAGEEAVATDMFDSVAADPRPGTLPAYNDFDRDHFAWLIFVRGEPETGLACDLNPLYMDTETGFMFSVARGWSNASAHAGHNPCVPTAAGAYFNVTLFPNEQDTISVHQGTTSFPTKGYRAQVGQARTFTVGSFSDAATASPISLQANVSNPMPNGQPNGTAMVSVDKTSGLNGEKAYVTVTPTAFGSMGLLYVELRTSIGGTQHNAMPVILGQ